MSRQREEVDEEEEGGKTKIKHLLQQKKEHQDNGWMNGENNDSVKTAKPHLPAVTR